MGYSSVYLVSLLVHYTLFIQCCTLLIILHSTVVLYSDIHYRTVCKSYSKKGKSSFSFDNFFVLSIVMCILLTIPYSVTIHLLTRLGNGTQSLKEECLQLYCSLGTVTKQVVQINTAFMQRQVSSKHTLFVECLILGQNNLIFFFLP